MRDRGDDGAGAGRATGSLCATPRSRPHRDGSPPCFLSDISGWSLSLVGGGPPRRLLAAVADSVLANAGSGDDGAIGGGRAQGATGSPCATPRSRPHRDGAPPCFLSDISGWSLSLVGGVAPRRLLAAVADSVLANAGSGRRWPRRDRRRASSGSYRVA